MNLSPFEDRDVAEASIKVTNAGDGLSEALGIEAAEFHQGDRVYVVLETTVAKVTYEPIKDTEELRRVHTLRAGVGAIVDEALVRKVVEEQRHANTLAREAAAGVSRIPGVDADADTEGATS